MACLRSISLEEVERVTALIHDAFVRDAQILLAGNGGSAALASHFACDLAKTALGPRPEAAPRRIRAVAITDNVPLITAWANDVHYESIFSEQVRALGRPADLLIAISASGSSPNIIAALIAAGETGMQRVGLLGFDGGLAKGLVEAHVLASSHDYGHVEIAHSMITHLIAQQLRERLAR